MKGLLIKDFKLLKGQKNFFFIVCLVGVMLMVTSASPSYVISYMTFVFSMFTLSSVSYDEYDNGLAFLFCLPVTRKKYVREVCIRVSAWRNGVDCIHDRDISICDDERPGCKVAKLAGHSGGLPSVIFAVPAHCPSDPV